MQRCPAFCPYYMAHLADDPVLRHFKGALKTIYGHQIDRVMLFGSRAHGDATAESDHDVAVFLKGDPNQRLERRRLADLNLDFLDETGALFDTKAFSVSTYHEQTALMSEIRRDGVVL
jgi:predicted nucleotidyltransferase